MITRKKRMSLFPSNAGVHSSNTHLAPNWLLIKSSATSGTSVKTNTFKSYFVMCGSCRCYYIHTQYIHVNHQPSTVRNTGDDSATRTPVSLPGSLFVAIHL